MPQTKATQPPNGDNNTQGLTGLLSVVMAQTQVIQSADNATDSKANNLMAAAFVVIALLATQLHDTAGNWRWVAVVAMMVEVIVVGLVIRLTRGRDYYGSVVDIDRREEYFRMDDVLLLNQLIKDADFANDHNEQILGSKQDLYKRCVFVFLAGFTLGVLSLFVSL